MLKIKTSKIDTKENEINTIEDIFQFFEPVSNKEKSELIEEIRINEELKRNLNITDETRKKKKSELNEKEKKALYDEYIYDSLICSCKSGIEYGTCDIKYFLQFLKNELKKEEIND